MHAHRSSALQQECHAELVNLCAVTIAIGRGLIVPDRRSTRHHLGKRLIAAQHGEHAAARHRRASGPAGRQVIALSGAGGLAILLGELITLRQQQLPVKIIVSSTAVLSLAELEMKAAAIVTYGTGLDNPGFAAIARAAGPSAMRVAKADELGNAAAVVRHHGPALGHGPHRPAGTGVGTAWLVLRIFTVRNC